MNKTDKTSIFKASLLAALMGAAFGVHAAGMGKLVVYSAIGQPLSAEVAISATPEELGSISARLAPHSAFKDAGIDFLPALTGLRFDIAKTTSGQPILKLSTDAPLNEPFLHFLVELSWTSGRMVREYTFLLDPPEMLKPAKPAAVVAPAMPAIQAKPLPAAPVQAAPMPAPMPAKPAMAAPAAEAEVKVKAGDTLTRIALEHKPESVSLDQMLVALFNSNRKEFDGENMNRLRAGKILRLPDPAEVAQVDARAARKLIVSQAADFNAYRRRLAEAAGSMPVEEKVAQQQAAGKIEAKVEAGAAPAPATDKLEVSRTESAKTTAGGGAGKSRLEEDLIARDKALREAAERIAQLEKNLDNLKHLVEMKSEAGAQMQQQAKAADAPKAEVPKAMAEPQPAEKPAAEPAPAVPADAAKTVEPAAPEPAAEAPKPAAPPPKPAPKPVVKKSAPPPPPPSFIEDNPELVFGGGGLIALLLGYFGYTAWRKKKKAREEAAFEDQPSVSENELAAKSGTVFGAASESVDSGEVSIQGDFSEGGVLTTEENVDPVAEADVLMAYGRDSQAEEILKEGMKADPTRGAIYLKLLELHANRKNAEAFEGVARQLHDLSNGQGPDWEKAAAMAVGLGITGGLFPAAAEVEPQPAPAESVPVAEAEAPRAEEREPLPEPEIAPAAEADTGSLDFDLDLGTTSGPAMAAAAQAEAAPAAAEEAMSLDFDFDLGTPEPVAAEVPVPAAGTAESVEAAEPAASEADMGNGIDFSLDIDSVAEAPVEAGEAAETPAVPAEQPEAAADANEIDFDLGMGGTDEAAEPAAAVELPASPVEEVSDIGGVDFDLELDSSPPAELAPAPEMAETVDEASPVAVMPELADISLDLGEETDIPVSLEEPKEEVALDTASLSEVPVPLEASVPAADAALELPDLDLGLDIETPAVADEADAGLPDIGALDVDLAEDAGSGDVQAAEAAIDQPDDPEVATKLELAQAYEEMGDREGARELLNEVLSEGSPAQQAAARARLDQLEA
ncbi:MAG: FimV/HubP family polar landmark protein [Pseudomonadota bacterium]